MECDHDGAASAGLAPGAQPNLFRIDTGCATSSTCSRHRSLRAQVRARARLSPRRAPGVTRASSGAGGRNRPRGVSAYPDLKRHQRDEVGRSCTGVAAQRQAFAASTLELCGCYACADRAEG